MTLSISQDKPKILSFPPTQVGYATARMILRDPDSHTYEAVDSAFEVLIYSPERNDQILCENVVDWLNQSTVVPTPMLFFWTLFVFMTIMGLCFWVSDNVRAWAIQDASQEQQP